MAFVTYKGPGLTRELWGHTFGYGQTVEIADPKLVAKCKALGFTVSDIKPPDEAKPSRPVDDATLPSIEPAVLAAEERKRLPEEALPVAARAVRSHQRKR